MKPLLPDQEVWDEVLSLASQAASQGEVPVGAVVVHKNQIVGRGYNRREQDQQSIHHAEILALQEASNQLGSWRLMDCVMVTTLEPCLMCLGALQQSRIDRVFYGARDPKGGALSLGYTFHEDQRLNHRFECIYVDQPACSEILSVFFKKLRNAFSSTR